MEIHEDKIIESDDWHSTYRLPELFGINERKKADLMEHLPEVVIEGDFMDTTNMAVASQAAIEHFQFQANDEDVKMRVISSLVDYGTGIKYDGVTLIENEVTPVDKKNPQMYLAKSAKTQKTVLYYGLAPTDIDLRDAFPDPSAIVDHDPTGQKGMQFFYRRIIYTEDAFKRDFYGKSTFKNVENVKPVTWADVEMFGIDREYTKHESEEKHGPADTTGQPKRYIVIFEGWDWILDEHVMMANGEMIYEGANPFEHKRLPVTFYWNYKRDDSIWGISEAEINAPFILIKEVLVNLMIDNAKLSQQPVIAISGDVNFDPDENELEPGALFTLQGLQGGKVGDAIQPLTFGSSVEPAQAVKQILEDMQIQVTGDDSRSLMVSPNELATQTLQKREALKKRIRKNIMMNTIRSERNSVMQQFSNICQFLARPYKDIQGKFKYHVIYVDGYKVTQRTKDDLPEFTPVSGYQGTFQLNSDILNKEKVRFKIVEKIEDAVKKEQELQALQWWMQTIFSLAQIKPEMLQNTDLELLAKQAGTRFTGLDVEAIFNASSRIVDGMDEMGYYIQQIALGIKPIIEPDGKNLNRLERFRRFVKTQEYKLLPKESKDMVKQVIIDIANAIHEEKNQSYKDYLAQISMAGTRQSGQQGAVPPGAGTTGTSVSRSAGAANQPAGQAQ